MKLKKLILVCLSIFSSVFSFSENIISVHRLTCEQEENPVGIETTKPRFSWQILSQNRNFNQVAYQIIVAESLEQLAANNGTIWNSGKVDTSMSILVTFAGKRLESMKLYFWKVRIWDETGQVSPWSLPQQYTMGLLSFKDWGEASWIAYEKNIDSEIYTIGIHAPKVNNIIGDKKIGMYKLPQFRKEILLCKPIKHAVTYISGLGHFDFFLNGEKVGNNFLDPGWTKYDKTALYVSFDITSQLKQGHNTLGVMLGNGFFNIPRKRYYKMLTSYGAPKMIFKLHVEYVDGTIQDEISDNTWKVTESPITYSSIYGGEDYDANLELENWMLPGYDDKSWNKALIINWKTELLSQRATPLYIREQIPTVSILKTDKGGWVYDLGQNFSGIIKLVVKSKGNNIVRLYPAELLNTDKSVNQSASGEPFVFSYKTRGNNIAECWQPQFTYYGFRYVQIEGAVPAGTDNPNGLPEIQSIVGLHTCNSAPQRGRFSSSNMMYNKIYSLIDWSIRSNMASVLTDCPHREKLGWLEVAHLMQYSMQYRYDLARLYKKVMQDMRSSQSPNGQIATTAPELVEFEGGFKDTPEWGSAFIIVPWYVYQWYGDNSLMTEFYPEMKRYIDYLSMQSKNHIVAYGLGDWFDIGPDSPGISQLTSNGVTATAIYYYNVSLMAKMASLLGNVNDAMYYSNLSDKIKEAFNSTFYNKKNGYYDRNSQASNAIAIYMDLVEPANKGRVLQNLIADIRSRNNALTAGDVGYRYVLRALEANAASNVIYDMNSKYDVPGYGWQLAHGATSLTESWQAYGFVSNNHCMLGHLMEWLFSGLGGIKQLPNSVAWKKIIIQPQPVGDINEAQTSLQSPYGLIRCEWKDTKMNFLEKVEIPANTEAYIHLPASSLSQITEGEVPVSNVKNISLYGEDNGNLILKVGSGSYIFNVKKMK